MPSMLRSFFAVMLGLMAIFVVRALAALVAVRTFGSTPGSSPTLQGHAFLFNVAAILLAAFIGGLFTGSLAGERRLRHGYVLAILLFLLSIMAASRNPVLGAPVQQVLLLVGPPILAVVGALVAERGARRTSAGGLK